MRERFSTSFNVLFEIFTYSKYVFVDLKLSCNLENISQIYFLPTVKQSRTYRETNINTFYKY